MKEEKKSLDSRVSSWAWLNSGKQNLKYPLYVQMTKEKLYIESLPLPDSLALNLREWIR